MKPNIIAAFVVLSLGLSALASPRAVYLNQGTITNAPVIDAITFLNEGTFEPVIALSNVIQGESLDTEAQTPFATRDTLYYTNLGLSALMVGQPGFNFQTFSGSGAHNASSFYNTGTILAIDAQTAPEVDDIGGVFVFFPGTGVAYPSQILILATNIYNGPNGVISVGADGLLEMYGKNITNNNALVAGNILDLDLYDGGSANNVFALGNPPGDEPYDATSIEQAAYTFTKIAALYFTAPPTLFDLYWGITSGGTLKLDSPTGGLDTGNAPGEPVTGRGVGNGKISLPFNGQGFTIGTNVVTNSGYATFIDTYSDSTGTNFYYNIVFVNTNFADTNIALQVLFTRDYSGYFSDVIGNGNPPDPNGEEAVVQFTVPCTDVITGQSTSNSLYLIDGGAIFSNTVALFTNAAWLSGYSRPSWFTVSTATPFEWSFAQPGDDPFDVPNVFQLLYPGITNSYEAKSVPYTSASYAVQAGVDPENLNGAFPFTEELFSTSPDIPDPTAEPARIDIEGDQVDLTGARIRADGLVTLLATNLVGGATAGVDWGMSDATIGASSGTLLISNTFPQSFTRVRGDVFAWSANWASIGTNNLQTNVFNFHMLVVDQALRGSFHPTVRNLTFTGTRNIDLEDPVTVLNQALFQTTDLTINSLVHMTQNVSSFGAANVPELESLSINTNGDFIVDNVLDLGLNPAINQVSPANRQYTIKSIANFGQIEATTLLLQSAFFENDGGITTSNSGGITIEADILNMGLLSTNQTNFMKVNGDILLSAKYIGVSNSTIIAGYTNGSLSSLPGSLTLQTTSDGQITDFVPDTPTTNNVLSNFWQVSDGFTMTNKPATGDLYGTEIKTIATNSIVALHTWAGAGGFTNPVDGFVDNVVIGKLTLSWQSPTALLHFTGAGSQNGLYVDFLNFDSNSLYQNTVASPYDYHDGLAIDTNLTIYFADSNVDPIKLMDAYPNRLVWVTNFVGPDNTTMVTNELNHSQICAVNSALVGSGSAAAEPSVEFFPGTQNNDNSVYPLNNPTNGEAWYYGANGCPAPPIPVETLVTPQLGSETGAGDFTGLNTNVATLTTNKQPFAAFKGTYNGLFFDTNQLLSTNAGFLSPTNSGFFTLTLSPNGAFSGRLLMGPTNYTFGGSKFDLSADATTGVTTAQTTVIAKHGRDSLTVNLQLGQQAGTGWNAVQGTVSNETWLAASTLQGDQDSWTAKNPATSYEGRYTMVLTNSGSNSVSLPGGDSYGLISVSKMGVLSVAGKLADGFAFSQSVPISQDGHWPFYTYVPGGKDFLMGWVYFQQNTLNTTRQFTISGNNIFWNKDPFSKDLFYPAGFASNTFDLVGYPYLNPGRVEGFVLPDPTNAMVILTNGGLSFSNIPVAYNGKLMYSSENLTLSINPTVGSFTGRFENPGGGPAIKLSGVAVQSPADDGAFEGAFGFFLGIDGQSGAVILQSP